MLYVVPASSELRNGDACPDGEGRVAWLGPVVRIADSSALVSPLQLHASAAVSCHLTRSSSVQDELQATRPETPEQPGETLDMQPRGKPCFPREPPSSRLRLRRAPRAS